MSAATQRVMLLCFHTAKSMGQTLKEKKKSYINNHDLESHMTPAKLLIVILIFFLSKLSYISSV